ncbi:ABC transporter substrate-binding protein [Chloroflexi bacterium]|nr:ABC transporter substrate-binding protein [Chloroflexota bacterium]
MESFNLHTAIANYGHTTTLKDGTFRSEQFQLTHTEISPVPMIFRRMVRDLEFDIAEMALATYICSKHYKKPFTALPVFLTRAFYHGGIICNVDSGITSPKDLNGKKIGTRSYTLTPGIWTKAILQTEHGVDLDSITWVLSGNEHVAEYQLPRGVISSDSDNLSEMLISGEVDAVIGAGTINSPNAVPLFDNPDDLDRKWFKKTGIYPISHLLVVKDDLLTQAPWLEHAIFDLFKTAKDSYVESLDGIAEPDSYDLQNQKMAEIVGGDPIPYNLEDAYQGIEAFIKFNVDQKIIPDYIAPETLFEMPT